MPPTPTTASTLTPEAIQSSGDFFFPELAGAIAGKGGGVAAVGAASTVFFAQCGQSIARPIPWLGNSIEPPQCWQGPLR